MNYALPETRLSFSWSLSAVPFNLRLGELTLLSPRIVLQTVELSLDDAARVDDDLLPPADRVAAGSEGFLIRSMPVRRRLPVLRFRRHFLCYVPSQYRRYYVNLDQTFEDYKSRFSSKTRSTLNRKLKKYANRSNGRIDWRAYRSEAEMFEFYELARQVSQTTYQERVLKSGLPSDDGFRKEMLERAQANEVRGFLLFDEAKPVAYLYCPSAKGILQYQYVGYDPSLGAWSIGTILLWCALESIFDERKFRLFDFTEGEGEHKREFSTHSVECANVYFLRPTLRNLTLVSLQGTIDILTAVAGKMLHWIGFKSRLKSLIRSYSGRSDGD